MDKIYSRRNVRIPEKLKTERARKHIRKTFKIIIIITIMILVSNRMIYETNLNIEEQGIMRAKNIATQITNEQSSEIMKKYEYEQLVKVERDNDGNVIMINANLATINKIISDIPIEVVKKMNDKKYVEFYISLGSMMGAPIFSGYGPKIKFVISSLGTIDTNLVSEFKECGINQTLHRIYLQMNTKVKILTAYNNTEAEISNQVLLAESVIVGKIPETYYNLDGMNNDDVTDVL